mmetsp:Transcript_25705/g.83033  ORF Transcript_25705/g.83033 Transcript_25705/m.83033 type:complete len:245 (-) Transcript_25705:354-1088(-)
MRATWPAWRAPRIPPSPRCRRHRSSASARPTWTSSSHLHWASRQPRRPAFYSRTRARCRHSSERCRWPSRDRSPSASPPPASCRSSGWTRCRRCLSSLRASRRRARRRANRLRCRASGSSRKSTASSTSVTSPPSSPPSSSRGWSSWAPRPRRRVGARPTPTWPCRARPTLGLFRSCLHPTGAPSACSAAGCVPWRFSTGGRTTQEGRGSLRCSPNCGRGGRAGRSPSRGSTPRATPSSSPHLD